MVRSRTWPSPGEGGAYSSTRKSDALGSPTGRETRTTRFAGWDTVVSSIFWFLVIASQRVGAKRRPMTGSAKQSSIVRERLDCFVAPLLAMTVFYLACDLGQRSVERRCRARQILERESAISGLLLRRGCRGPDLGDRLSVIEQGQRRDHLKFMGLDRLVLQQKDAERDDVLAAPVGNISVDRDRTVALHAAELCIALGVQKLVRLEALYARRVRLCGFFGQIVLPGHLLAERGELPGDIVFEFLQLGARLRGLAGLGGIPLLQFGLALRDDFGDGFPLRIDQQIL